MNKPKTIVVNGETVIAPPLAVNHTYHCSHIVSIDGQPMETILAVQYLLVRCDQLRTEIADLKSGAGQEDAPPL